MKAQRYYFQHDKGLMFSHEIVITLALMVVGLISTYICFNTDNLIRHLIFLLPSVVVLFMASKINAEVIVREFCLPINLLLLSIAIIITLSKNQSGYITLSDYLAFNVPDIIMYISVFSSVTFQNVIKNQKIKNKIVWCILLILPIIIISAFNSSSSSFVFIATLLLSNLLPWLEEQYSSEKIAGYVLITLTILSIITVILIIIFAFFSNFFSSYFTGNEANYIEVSNLRFTYLIYKTGLLFPISFIILTLFLCLTMIFKTFLLKSFYNKTIVFSISFSIMLHLILSVLFEVFLKNNNGLNTPFLSSFTSMVIMVALIGMSISITGNASPKITVAYIVKCINSVFKRRSSSPIAFISYRRETGSDLAMHVHDRLQLKGINSFFDIESMKSGKFNEQIYQKIDECPNFILVLSKDALERCKNDNDWVKNEIAYAIKTNKNIIPLITKDFIYPDILPDEIESIRYYQGVSATNEFFDFMIEKLIKMMK